MSDSLPSRLFFILSVISLSIDSCKLSSEFMKCPIAGDLSPDRLGCPKDSQAKAAIACPKDDHSCLVILNENNSKKQTLVDGLCIRNGDNAITRILANKGKYNETQYEKSYFQWENPCFMGDGEYVVDSNRARMTDTKVCCSGECTEKDPIKWAKDEKVMWVTFVGGIFTGFFAFLLTFSATYPLYKKRRAKYLILRVSQSK